MPWCAVVEKQGWMKMDKATLTSLQMGEDRDMRDLILREIRGLAARNSSQPPGKQAFTRATGITEGKWSGVFWARWSDALAEAGFAPNTLQGRSDSMDILLKVAGFCLRIGRLPTSPEIQAAPEK